jgi:hypothetical protein
MRVFFSIPPITRSTASSNYLIPTLSKLVLAAIIAASLQMLEMSAPLNPGVKVAILLAYSELIKSLLSFIFLRCTLKISILSLIVGRVISIYLSNLPGLNSALSRISALFDAANTITESSVPNPSISTSN